MRGRKPKPSFLKLIDGNPGKRPINEAEPQPQGDLRQAPAHWSGDEYAVHRAAWDEAIASAPSGLLRRLDSSLLETWVVASVLHREAVEKVRRLGMMIRAPGSNYPMQNPYLPVVNTQAKIMLRAAAEMGFTPSSRSRVKLEKSSSRKSHFSDLKEWDED